MSSWESGRRPITIAILAMGGEGGGVLSNWIVSLGEASGYISQSTSVAGVAQRTGATVYYVELYPESDQPQKGSARNEPILSLFPTPGQVDVVIASELMEAGRALQRGFSTPDRTTLIASTNRVYSVTEKMDLGDGRVDVESLLGSAKAGSKLLIAADFSRLALEAGSVISASLFGAFAGSGVIPVPRENYEETIRKSGKGVERSLAAFAAPLPAHECFARSTCHGMRAPRRRTHSLGWHRVSGRLVSEPSQLTSPAASQMRRRVDLLRFPLGARAPSSRCERQQRYCPRCIETGG